MNKKEQHNTISIASQENKLKENYRVGKNQQKSQKTKQRQTLRREFGRKLKKFHSTMTNNIQMKNLQNKTKQTLTK